MIIEVVCTANIAIVLKRKNFLRKYLQLRAIFLHKMTFWGEFYSTQSTKPFKYSPSG
jgi:hypothetical protein